MFARLRDMRSYARAPHFRTACGVHLWAMAVGRTTLNRRLLTAGPAGATASAVVSTFPAGRHEFRPYNIHARLSATQAHFIRWLCATHRSAADAAAPLADYSRRRVFILWPTS